MKVKIGKNIYSANVQPIMLILDEQDIENIKNMAPGATKYCAFPSNYQTIDVETFMKLNNDNTITYNTQDKI